MIFTIVLFRIIKANNGQNVANKELLFRVNFESTIIDILRKAMSSVRKD
jgi:hypothetical protein